MVIVLAEPPGLAFLFCTQSAKNIVGCQGHSGRLESRHHYFCGPIRRRGVEGEREIKAICTHFETT